MNLTNHQFWVLIAVIVLSAWFIERRLDRILFLLGQINYRQKYGEDPPPE